MEVVEIESSRSFDWKVRFYDHKMKRVIEGAMSDEEMEEEFDILPPVMIELYVE
jgi:hypothetical protein